VSNAALDLGRQRGRRDVLSLNGAASGDGEAWHPVCINNPTAGLEQEDLRRALMGALATLSEAQRQTFVLHAEAGLSYREVADALEISIGTVMSRLYYARQRLRAHLGEQFLPGNE
jgi:RNA polymerase sigma-70 factor (ECF subfamily)